MIQLARLNREFEAEIDRALRGDLSTKKTDQAETLHAHVEEYDIDLETAEYLARTHYSNMRYIIEKATKLSSNRDNGARYQLADQLKFDLADLNNRVLDYANRTDPNFVVPKSLERIALRLLRENNAFDYPVYPWTNSNTRYRAERALILKLAEQPNYYAFLDLLISAELEIANAIKAINSGAAEFPKPQRSSLEAPLTNRSRRENYSIQHIAEQVIEATSTSEEWNGKLRRIAVVLRDLGLPDDVREIRQSDLFMVRDCLLRCPANKTQLFPGLSYMEAIEANKKRQSRCLSPNTVKNGYLAPLKKIFIFAKERELIAHDLQLNKVKVPGVVKYGNTTHFHDEELRRIFMHPIYGQNLKANGEAIHPDKPQEAHWVWGPIVALFTGARTAEIAALQVSDVVLDGDIPYLIIRPSKDRRIKTHSSSREVPLHQMLIDLGFSKVVERSMINEHDVIFPGWVSPPGKKLADAPSQRHFRRNIVPSCSERTHPKPNFHSFRNTMKSKLINAGVNIQLQNALLGHEQDSMTKAYGTGITLPAMRDAINKFEFRCNEIFSAKLH